MKLVEAATDAQRRATDGSGFQVEVVQHLLTMQMQHPQLRSAIRQVSTSLLGAQMRREGWRVHTSAILHSPLTEHMLCP